MLAQVQEAKFARSLSHLRIMAAHVGASSRGQICAVSLALAHHGCPCWRKFKRPNLRGLSRTCASWLPMLAQVQEAKFARSLSHLRIMAAHVGASSRGQI